MVGRIERPMKRGAKGGQRSKQGRRDELLANRMRKKEEKRLPGKRTRRKMRGRRRKERRGGGKVEGPG